MSHTQLTINEVLARIDFIPRRFIVPLMFWRLRRNVREGWTAKRPPQITHISPRFFFLTWLNESLRLMIILHQWHTFSLMFSASFDCMRKKRKMDPNTCFFAFFPRSINYGLKSFASSRLSPSSRQILLLEKLDSLKHLYASLTHLDHYLSFKSTFAFRKLVLEQFWDNFSLMQLVEPPRQIARSLPPFTPFNRLCIKEFGVWTNPSCLHRIVCVISSASRSLPEDH